MEAMNLTRTSIQGLTTIYEAARRDSTQSTRSITHDLIEQIKGVYGALQQPDIRLPPVAPFSYQGASYVSLTAKNSRFTFTKQIDYSEAFEKFESCLWF